MSQFFAADSKPMLFLSRFFDGVLLSLLFLICCIPVVTIGPALSALYETARKVVMQRKGYLVRTFVSSLRANFVQGLCAWLILLLISLLMVMNIWYCGYYLSGALRIVLMAFYFAVLFAAMICMGYIFPMLSRFVCSMRQLFSNTAALVVAYPLYTVGIFLLQLLFYALLSASILMAPLFAFFLPVLFAVAQAGILEKIFVQCEKDF